MNEVARRSRNAVAFCAIVLLATAMSLGLYHVWDLERRWIIVVFTGIAAVAVSMCLARKFSDFLLIVTFFTIPLAPFMKWIYPTDLYAGLYQGALIGTFGVGLLDFLLIGLYMSWFYRVFIIRTQELPRLNLLDGLILGYIAIHLLASVGAYSGVAAFGACEYLIKHAMLYFYVSRHVEERHLPWLLAAFGVTIALETLLATYQYSTGKLIGLALDKGAGGAELNTQYDVPGVEKTRATGTSTDSHMLADYIGAMLPFALVLLFTPRLRPLLRIACLAASGGAALVIVLTQSRTGWIATASVLVLGVVLILALWRERQVVPAIAGLVLVAALITPFVANFIYERFANSPSETISTRFEEFQVAWYIFTLYPSFGVGPSNYIHALTLYDYIGMTSIDPITGEIQTELLPVHNGMLLHLAELGIFGLLFFLALLASVMRRLFRVVRTRLDVPGRLALGALLGILNIVINDQFIVGFHNPDVFMTFWILAALAVALPPLPRDAGGALLLPTRSVPRPVALSGLAAGSPS